MRLQLGPQPGAPRGGQGGRAHQLARRLPRALRSDPARSHEHVHDHQRHQHVDVGAVRGPGARARHGREAAARHHAERHRQGVPGARDLHLSARRQPAHHRRDVRVVPRAGAQLERQQHLLVSLAGSGRDASAGAVLRAGERHRHARHAEAARALHARAVRAVGGAHQLLREQRHPLHRRDVQDARVLGDVGGDHHRALPGEGQAHDALPLRRAGELAGPHREPAREQRVAHPDRDARRDAQPQRALPCAPAAGLERGALAAAPVGPAVVAAPPADPRVRDRPARVPGLVRRQPRDRQQGGRAQGAGLRRDPEDPRHGRREGGHRQRLHEVGASAQHERAHGPHQHG